MRLRSDLPAARKYQAVIVESAAREAGLDFFEVVFELLDARDVNGVAAYGGFPVRYPSWRFGMEYERLEKGRQWGLSKIYELVINNDPTYAYLVRSNSMLEQKLVMAHVYGHADFFKHNLWFAPSERKMLDAMGDHSVRVRRIVDLVGLETVERFLDRCLSLDTLVDPYLPLREHSQRPERPAAYTPPSERSLRSLEALASAPHEPLPTPARSEPRPAAARVPTYDLLGFLEARAPLQPWQRELLHVVRREAYYFVPQRMTKIMNEGWASYWHSRLLTGGLLEPGEVLDFADCHSAATYAPAGQTNPYKLGIELYRHAEARGEELFRLRRVHNDVSLIHKLVDEPFAEEFLRPIFNGRPALPADAPAPSWQDLKSRLLQEISWGGLPMIELVDVDAEGKGELQLVHHHDGRDLALDRARETLLNLGALWGGPIELATRLEREPRRLVCEDGEVRVLDTHDGAAGRARGKAKADAAEERQAS